MTDDYDYENKLSIFENRSYRFQEATSIVLGTEIRDEYDAFCITSDFVDLFWEKAQNGMVVVEEDIFVIRGSALPTLGSVKNKHHWPPSSRNGEDVIKISAKFHRAWHDIFMNLYKEEEFELFWKVIFDNECDDLHLRNIIDQIRKEVLFKEKKRVG